MITYNKLYDLFLQISDLALIVSGAIILIWSFLAHTQWDTVPGATSGTIDWFAFGVMLCFFSSLVRNAYLERKLHERDN